MLKDAAATWAVRSTSTWWSPAQTTTATRSRKSRAGSTWSPGCRNTFTRRSSGSAATAGGSSGTTASWPARWGMAKRMAPKRRGLTSGSPAEPSHIDKTWSMTSKSSTSCNNAGIMPPARRGLISMMVTRSPQSRSSVCAGPNVKPTASSAAWTHASTRARWAAVNPLGKLCPTSTKKGSAPRCLRTIASTRVRPPSVRVSTENSSPVTYSCIKAQTWPSRRMRSHCATTSATLVFNMTSTLPEPVRGFTTTG